MEWKEVEERLIRLLGPNYYNYPQCMEWNIKIMNENKDYVVVTAISMYRMRYVMHKNDLTISSPGIKTTLTSGDTTAIEIAMDAVTMNECEEFSQEHVGEYIIDTMEMSEDNVLELYDKENDYLSEWTKEKKLVHIRGLRAIGSERSPRAGE